MMVDDFELNLVATIVEVWHENCGLVLIYDK